MTSNGSFYERDIFKNINKIASECNDKLFQLSDHLVSETNRLKKILESYPINQLESCLELLNVSKMKIWDIVEHSFQKLEEKIRRKHANMLSSRELEDKARFIIETISENQYNIHNYHEYLNDKDKYLDAIKHIQDKDFERDNTKIQRDINNFHILLQRNKIELEVNMKALDNLIRDLEQFIFIHGAPTNLKDELDDTYEDKLTQREVEDEWEKNSRLEENGNIVYQFSPLKTGGTSIQNPDHINYEQSLLQIAKQSISAFSNEFETCIKFSRSSKRVCSKKRIY